MAAASLCQLPCCVHPEFPPSEALRGSEFSPCSVGAQVGLEASPRETPYLRPRRGPPLPAPEARTPTADARVVDMSLRGAGANSFISRRGFRRPLDTDWEPN